jgi:hypothetical protein
MFTRRIATQRAPRTKDATKDGQNSLGYVVSGISPLVCARYESMRVYACIHGLSQQVFKNKQRNETNLNE